MDCPRVRYPQFNDTVENELAEQGYQVLTDSSEQVRLCTLYLELNHRLYHRTTGSRAGDLCLYGVK